MCIYKVGIPYFQRDTASQFSLFAQFKSKRVNHANKRLFEQVHINGILLKSSLLAHALLLVEWQYRAIIQSISLFPDTDTVHSQYTFHCADFHLLYRCHFVDPHVAKQPVGFLSNHWDFSDRKRSKKRTFGTAMYIQLPTWFCLSRSYFGNGLIDRQAKADRKPCFFYDMLTQLLCPLPTAEKPIHPR